MDGSLSDFITMQIIGIALFMIAANTSHLISDRIGRERTILLGSVLSAIGAGSILVYALTFEHKAPEVLWVLFAFLNTGVGIRGPGGFFMAIFASKNNNARATAIVLLMMFLLVAGTTALVAPFIASGLIPLALATTTLCAASLLIMWLIPGLPDDDFNTEKNISG
jgi:MFS family permease